MATDDTIGFLQWALPRLGLAWRGFRKVQKQVAKRINRRLRELGLADLAAYRAHLETHPEEWRILDALTNVTISRFYRDRRVFDALAHEVLPSLAEAARREARALRAWSVGAASGEEPYTLALIAACSAERTAGDAERTPPARGEPAIEIVASERDPELVRRARTARYRRSSLRELPEHLLARGFTRHADDTFALRPTIRRPVNFVREDVRETQPDGPFDLVLCRNLAFIYFDERGRERMLARIGERIRPDGVLVIGNHDRLPEGDHAFVPISASRQIFRREDR